MDQPVDLEPGLGIRGGGNSRLMGQVFGILILGVIVAAIVIGVVLGTQNKNKG